ncbi:uncharacterized protein LOC111049496 [Nilaparvata lugens]|uniref:uncharacterized protein LOC111049496 n=1 Tax=Nilaparvata lugens TaxID=108931 RepID=UPI00193D880D|nr:uncharacterized protein LOC111049496 [Nilaparvata lugens]
MAVVLWSLIFAAATRHALAVPAASLESHASRLQADPISRNSIQTGSDLMDSIYSDCLNKGSVSCVKYKLFTFVDKMLNKDSFSLTEGVTVVRNPGAATPVGDGAPRALSGEEQPASADSQDVESMVVDRVERFLQTHSVKIDLKGSDVVKAVSNAGRAFTYQFMGGLDEEDEGEEAGRKKVKKGGKVLLPLLLMLKMKAAALLPLALGAIALIAGKALLIGKIALLLASIIGLKKLLSQQKTVTYEIVSHPHHTSSHEHHGHDSFSSGGSDLGGGYGGGGGHGGWGRSADPNAAHDLAYNAYAPATDNKQ